MRQIRSQRVAFLHLTNIRFAISLLLNLYISLVFGAWFPYPLVPKLLRYRPDYLFTGGLRHGDLIRLFFPFCLFLCLIVFLILFQYLEGEPTPKAGVKAGILSLTAFMASLDGQHQQPYDPGVPFGDLFGDLNSFRITK